MSGSFNGSDDAKRNIAEAAENTPDVNECTSGCPCEAFARYNDPFAANYRITNCAGLSARLRDKWGNLRAGKTGQFRVAIGITIDCVMTVDGMRDAARAAGAFTDRGADITSPAPSNPCDILFALWVLRSGKWGAQLADKNGKVAHKMAPNTGEDFHIVSVRLDKDGNVPADVYSTNGQRPFEGPKTMGEWAIVNGSPATTQPANQMQFYESATVVPDTTPYVTADIPRNSIILGSVATTFDPAKYYYRLELYNDDPTPEAFIIDDEFMKTFSSSN